MQHMRIDSESFEIGKPRGQVEERTLGTLPLIVSLVFLCRIEGVGSDFIFTS